MSGHSKWSSIKHKKGAADKKRGQLFSKLSRAIIVAAREGGGDPSGNLALQNAVEKAKSLLDAEGEHRARDRPRRRAPTLTRTRTRPSSTRVTAPAASRSSSRPSPTTATVRPRTFARRSGSTTETSARPAQSRWQFERRGMVLVDADGVDEDELMLAAAEGGADDVELDGSTFQITAAPEVLTAVREALEAGGFKAEAAELTMVPKTTVEVAEENTAKKILRLMDALEENDDVQDVYANFDIPERVLETVAG